MAAHVWRKTDKVVDGDEIWECEKCDLAAPGVFRGQPPLTVDKSDALPWNGCEEQLVNDVHGF